MSELTNLIAALGGAKYFPRPFFFVCLVGPDYELPELLGLNFSTKNFSAEFFRRICFWRTAVGRRSDGRQTAVRRPSDGCQHDRHADHADHADQA